MKKKITHISFSEYRLFLDCPFKHYLQKVKGLDQDSNQYLIFGSALHSSIEEVIANNPERKLFDSIFKDNLIKESNPHFIRMSLGKQLLVYGGALLKELDFFERYKGWEVFCVEQEIYESLYETDEEIKNFKGFIDLVLKKGDQYLIIDWKSANKPWDIKAKQKDKEFFGQLALYKHFFSLKHNIPLENIQTRFVTLAKEPINIQQYNIEISDEFMNQILEQIVEVAKAIGNVNIDSLPKAKHTNKKGSCYFCPFNNNVCNEEEKQIV